MIASQKQPQLTRFRDAKIVTIIVGEDKKEWKMPMSLLCFHSGYFQSALKGGFAEAKAKRVKLLDEKPATFEVVVNWLYTHDVGVRVQDDSWEEHCATIGKLLDTWILAEYLQMPRLQNTIIRLMSDQITKMPNIPYKKFNRVCQIVGRDTPLYTWMGECAVWVESMYDGFYDECLEELALDILVNFCKKNKTGCFISGDECPINESCLVEELDY